MTKLVNLVVTTNIVSLILARPSLTSVDIKQYSQVNLGNTGNIFRKNCLKNLVLLYSMSRYIT